MNERTCQSCGREFTSRRRDAAYCSCACRQRAHRSMSRIKPPDAEVVRGAAQDKPLAVPEPATATLQAEPICDRQGSDKGAARWRKPLVWPDFIG